MAYATSANVEYLQYVLVITTWCTFTIEVKIAVIYGQAYRVGYSLLEGELLYIYLYTPY